MTDAAVHSLRQKASLGIDIEGATVGSGGSLSSLITQGADKSAQNYQLIRDWVATCLSAICRRTSSQNFGAGEKVKATDADKFSFFAHKSQAAGRRLPPSIKETITGSLALKPFEDHPALEFLQQPNPLQGKREFIDMWIMNLYASGQAYVIGGDMGNEGGKQAWVIPTPWLTPKHDGGLFTSYVLKPDGMTGEGIPVPKEAVHRAYFPDPSNLKKALCPIITQLRAIRIDESIQASQEQMFDKGIFPNVILEVGDTVGPDGKSMGKPVLTGAQRRQLVRAVREIWNATLSNGDPAIIDGLIKDIKKLNAMPAEMDWLQSGKAIKERIFQMFGLNPIIVGEIVGANRAQASVADQSFIDNTVNPLTDRITVMLNNFIAPMFMGQAEGKAPAPSGKKLYLWLEEAVPKDDDLLLRKTTAGRTDGSISRNEARSAQGLPPKETPACEIVGLASTAAGAAAITNLLMQVGMGNIAPDSAHATLVTIYGVTEEEADAMIGSTEYVEPPAPTVVQQIPKPTDKPGNAPPKPDEGDMSGDNPAAAISDVIQKASGAKITRGEVKAAHRRQVVRLEKEVASVLRPFFGDSTIQQLRGLLPATKLRSSPEAGTPS
jgi:phage portal protein BeeE